jgi:hypothetical protein
VKLEGVRSYRFHARDVVEPISPELVLVDPELARAERARLLAHERLQPPAAVEPILHPAEQAPPAKAPPIPLLHPPIDDPPQAAERARKRVTPVLLTISLLANAVLISVVIAGASTEAQSVTLGAPLGATTTKADLPLLRPSPAARRSTSGRSVRPSPAKIAVTSPGRSGAKRSRSAVDAGVRRETNGAVEGKLLALVVQSPKGKLPPTLIDPKTGLGKNNLQAVCNASGGSTSFLCVVRPARHRPTEGLYVRYRPTRSGRGVFTWYRYRTG